MYNLIYYIEDILKLPLSFINISFGQKEFFNDTLN